MGNICSSRFDRADWLTTGPLAPHVDAYKQHLIEGGYAAGTIACCLSSVSHLSQWMCRSRLRIEHVNETMVAEFLGDHLPRCQCRAPVLRVRSDLSAALGHLLVVLRARGAIAPPAVGTRPVDEELRRYDEYMAQVRGLAPNTRDGALRIVRRLLMSRFRDGAIDIAAIKPEHVRRFFAQQAKLYSKPVSAGTVVASLRGYFRYRATLGDTVHALVGAVSYPANWQLASLPKTLKSEEVDQLVSSLGEM